MLPNNKLRMRTLTVATDYSGIEAPLLALTSMRQKISHEFSSETCSNATQVIKARFNPKRLFPNALTKRILPRKLDIYVAGFPCPVFSSISALGGYHQNERNPLKHFKNCILVAKACKAKVFILENVKNIKHTQGGQIWKRLQQHLRKECGSQYHLVSHVLNTKDYGIPQNRQRVYIIGLRRDIAFKALSCPQKVPLTLRFEDLMEKRAQRRTISLKTQRRYDSCATRFAYPIFMSITLPHCSGSKTPVCLTKSGQGMYWSKKNIVTTVREELRLQGFPDTFKFPEGMSDTVCRQLIGNSMSVNVLKALFKQIFKETKLTKQNHND